MTAPTDLPDLDQDLDEPAADFDDLAIAKLQRYMVDEIGVDLAALEAETLLQLLRPHIVQSFTAEFAAYAPTPYEVRRDALGMAATRFAGHPPALDPDEDISLALAPIYEELLAEKVEAGTAPVELVDGNTEHDVDQEPAGD